MAAVSVVGSNVVGSNLVSATIASAIIGSSSTGSAWALSAKFAKLYVLKLSVAGCVGFAPSCASSICFSSEIAASLGDSSTASATQRVGAGAVCSNTETGSSTADTSAVGT